MWHYEKDGGTVLQVKVIPGARKSGVVGVLGDFLKVKITASPQKGRANDALIEFFAKRLNVAPSQIHIIRGQTQPLKLLFVPVASEIIKSLIK